MGEQEMKIPPLSPSVTITSTGLLREIGLANRNRLRRLFFPSFALSFFRLGVVGHDEVSAVDGLGDCLGGEAVL